MLLGILSVWLLFFQSAAWSVQNSLELHSGTVKIIRSGKSQILQKAGETYSLSANDRLQTGENTQVTLYLNDRDNMVKLFSHSFFKLDDISEQENNVALFTGKANFSVKPLPGSSGAGEDESKIGKKDKATARELKAKLGGNLKGSLAKLGKSKLSRKKKRFKVRTVSAVIGVRGTKFVLATGSFSPNRADLLVLPEKEPGTKSEATLANTKLSEYEEKVGPGEVSRVVEDRGPTVSVTISPEEIARIAEADGPDSFQGVEFGLSESIDSIQERQRREDKTPRFDEKIDAEGEFLEQLDRLEELETVVSNAENAIDSAKSKILILSMTFTNR
ncbi:MAG: iron dicitrate transport regulator FecR [SAR324 cluster bacterium]|nr:iron dicitrate transport regulator FecR [SAR324 cluster bacterium]